MYKLNSTGGVMSKKPLWLGMLVVLIVVVGLIGALAGCGGSADTGGGAPADVALKITGNVEQEMAWTEDEVRAMDAIEAEYTNKEGETATYTGVPINALLDKAGVKDGATAVVFVADDDYTAEATLAEVQGCADCIVSFRDEGGFSTVMPGFSGKLQVKGVIEIQVK
jgi:hypothetical protein